MLYDQCINQYAHFGEKCLDRIRHYSSASFMVNKNTITYFKDGVEHVHRAHILRFFE